jgi:hypothetical protein
MVADSLDVPYKRGIRAGRSNSGLDRREHSTIAQPPPTSLLLQGACHPGEAASYPLGTHPGHSVACHCDRVHRAQAGRGHHLVMVVGAVAPVGRSRAQRPRYRRPAGRGDELSERQPPAQEPKRVTTGVPVRHGQRGMTVQFPSRQGDWLCWPDFGLTRSLSSDKRRKTLRKSPQITQHLRWSRCAVKISTDQKVGLEA